MSRVIRHATATVAAIRPASPAVSLALPVKAGPSSGEDPADRRLAAAVQAHHAHMGSARFVQMARTLAADVPAQAGFGRFRSG